MFKILYTTVIYQNHKVTFYCNSRYFGGRAGHLTIDEFNLTVNNMNYSNKFVLVNLTFFGTVNLIRETKPRFRRNTCRWE